MSNQIASNLIVAAMILLPLALALPWKRIGQLSLTRNQWTAIEYGLIAALICVAAITAMGVA